MSDKVQRRYWQIHLSTAAVLMFVAGAFLGLNFYCRSFNATGDGEWGPIGQMVSGWPCAAFEQDSKYVRFARPHEDFAEFFDEPVELIHVENNHITFLAVACRFNWIIPGLVLNIASAIATLFTVACLFELLFRRRERGRA